MPLNVVCTDITTEMKIIRKPKKVAVKKPKYQSLERVLRDTYTNWTATHSVEAYDIDFNKVQTSDLITLYRNLTLFTYWIGDLKVSSPDLEREAYLHVLASVIDVKFNEMDAKSIKNKTFLENRPVLISKLKAILATREHIPNKKQAKEIRRKKAQGKFIVD